MKKILEYQHWHVLFLGILLFCIYFFAKTDATFLNGKLFGISTFYWCIFALLSAIIHQVYVLLCWRYELYHQSLSKSFGENGFKWYKIVFTVLILSRPITILLLAISNRNTLNIDATIAYILASILMLPVIYLAYSIKTYFGTDRAFGIDHFYPEKFKNAPLVKQGIFKYTSNSMYVWGFLLFWAIALFFQSKAALGLAFFHHAYIWVHYFWTELPDMKVIYSEK